MTRDHARQEIAEYLAARAQRRDRARITTCLGLFGAIVLTLVWVGALIVIARRVFGV